jgi:hypothetical protein
MQLEAASKLTSLLFLFALSSIGAIAFADEGDKPRESLASEIAYNFVGHHEIVDDQGRLLVWEATIEGDISGELLWWFVQPSPATSTPYAGGRIDYYGARWEIQVAGELVLAGESAGKTVWADGADGIWDGHGVVTEALGDFSMLKGHKTYETGPVFKGSNPPVSYSGKGLFVIY